MRKCFIAFSLASIGFIVLFLSACDQHADTSERLRIIDSLSVRLDTASAAFMLLDRDTLDVMRKTIEVHLDYIQKNFVGEMRADIGQHASRYKTTRKLLEQTSEEISRGMEETKYTLQQLANLKQALMEQATHDAQGNPMDETYVKKAIGRETEEAGKLIKSSKLLPENVTKAKRFFLEQSPKIQFWVDSIPAIQETATDIK